MDAHFLAVQTALAGRYSIERELGRGGMGVVYLAHEVALDRPVALKMLPPELSSDAAVRGRFLSEARTAARLSHPHIVPIFSVDEVDDFVFFAMAAIEGLTLGERVRAQGPLSNPDATRVVKEVAWALAYAHAQGVVHRDIKPDNILLERGTGRALVTDFGIAQVGAPDVEGPTQVVGTAEFMSPEQAKGTSVDARSDMYSLAVVGFYAVSGRTPFEGPSGAAVMGMHVTVQPPVLSSVVPGVAPALARVIDRCLRKDPERRLLGGESVADALSREDSAERHLPIPLRVFVKNLRKLARDALAATVIICAMPIIVGMLGGGLVFGGFMAALGGSFGLSVLWYARKALKAGFTPAEIRLALEEDVIRRNEEIRFVVGPRTTAVDRVANFVAVTGGLMAATLPLGILLGGGTIGRRSIAVWLAIAGIGGLAGLLAAGLRAHRSQTRADIAGERWLKVWRGRIGDALFKVAGLRVKSTGGAPEGAHRLTEVMLGLAAAHLFEELPKESRRELGDLPATVKDLERDARSLREQVRELTSVLDELEDDQSDAAVERRELIRRDVSATRDQAEDGLRAVVAALETIRVGLLRMHAGESVVQSVTMDVEAAREVAQQMERLLDGHREVEQILRQRRATGTFTIHEGDG